MKQLLFLIVYFCFFTIDALPPSNNLLYKDFIVWSNDKKLEWNNFKGTPVENAAEVAMTASSVELNYNTNAKTLNWTVTPKFFPKLSWVKSPLKSAYILQHEQLHFDITELYARILRKQLTENIHSVNDLQQLQRIGRSIFKQWQEEENKYDIETNHSVDKEQQLLWENNIKERLEELSAFATK